LRLGLAGHNLNLSGLWINLESGYVQASCHSSFEGAGYVLLSEAGYAGHGFRRSIIGLDPKAAYGLS
jgi:hypothetical protein